MTCTCGPNEACGECPRSGCVENSWEAAVFRALETLEEISGDAAVETYYRIEAAQSIINWTPFLDLGDGQGPYHIVRPRCGQGRQSQGCSCS